MTARILTVVAATVLASMAFSQDRWYNAVTHHRHHHSNHAYSSNNSQSHEEYMEGLARRHEWAKLHAYQRRYGYSSSDNDRDLQSNIRWNRQHNMNSHQEYMEGLARRHDWAALRAYEQRYGYTYNGPDDNTRTGSMHRGWSKGRHLGWTKGRHNPHHGD